jgi:hypothetical protein
LSNINNNKERQGKVEKVVRHDTNICGAYLAQVLSIEGLVKDII